MSFITGKIPFLFLWCVSNVLSWELSLLHVNDIHVRMEETSKYSSPCKEKDQKAGKCYGGLARISAAVKKFKSEENNVVWLNAGDFFQGTIWYSKFKWEPVAQFNNLLEFDAMTLGNHEFDNGMDGLLPFLKNTTCPIVVSNIDAKNSETQFSKIVKPSVILDIAGKKVGVVGYITPETVFTSSPPKNLEFLDEVEEVTKEVHKLTQQGIDIIIALGHSGYEKDKEIAEKVPDIDIVVGAHTHSFLFTETDKDKNPSNNEIAGPYPTIVENTKGKKVLVVQAYAFTKYLGQIKVNFSNSGEVTNWQGMPILLDNKFEKDETITKALAPWKKELVEVSKKIVGETKVLLKKSRQEETNLGNLLTDAMVYAYENETNVDGQNFNIALLNSGGIRSSIDVGNISLGQVMTVFPFESTMDTLSLTGAVIREMLEQGAKEFTSEGSNGAGGFFQVSGLRVTYDMTRDPGNRVVKVQVLCDQCKGDSYEDLNDANSYAIITTSYIANGGDGMQSLSSNKKNHEIGKLDTQVMQNYLTYHPVLERSTEGRIQIITSSSSSSSSSALFSMFLFTIMFLITMQ